MQHGTRGGAKRLSACWVEALCNNLKTFGGKLGEFSYTYARARAHAHAHASKTRIDDNGRTINVLGTLPGSCRAEPNRPLTPFL
jgi:hypothetical protein